MDMRDLLEKMDQFAGQAVGQRPGDQVRGTEKAKTGGKKHPFAGRLVGASESVLPALDRMSKERNVHREIAEAWAQFQEQDAGVGSAQQLSIQQLATISDEALDNAYHYGRSQPGNTFGWQANLKSAAYAKQMIDKGVTDIEAISDAIHKGWNTTAQAFVKNPDQFSDTEKLKAAGKLEAKLQQRAQLMTQNYAQLPEEEKEKDRVVARAMLQAITGGEQGVAEATGDPKFDKMLTGITGKKAVAKQQKADTKQQARDAFGGMFGGGNPANRIGIKKKGVAEDLTPTANTTMGQTTGAAPATGTTATPANPQDAAKLQQQQALTQKNLSTLKNAGVDIDPAKAMPALQKAETGAPMSSTDQAALSKMAPAIGKILQGPQGQQLANLVKSAGAMK
jgi:hypothetical protein